MYVKKKSIEGYFSHSLSLKAWRKGKVLFDEIANSVAVHPDGRYEARLVEAGFEMAKARPFSFFVFELPGSGIVKKAITIDGVEGITRLLFDLAKFGIFPGGPHDLQSVYEKLNANQPRVILSLETRDDLRQIVIESHIKEVVKIETPPPAPAVKVQVTEEPPAYFAEHANEVPASTLPKAPDVPRNPAPAPAPAVELPAPAAKPGEADIKPGDNIIVKVRGIDTKATVLKEFPDDYELAVQLEDGNKVIVSGNDVVAMA